MCIGVFRAEFAIAKPKRLSAAKGPLKRELIQENGPEIKYKLDKLVDYCNGLK